MYKFYKKSYTQPVTLTEYIAIINGFALFLIRKIFEGYDVELSHDTSLGVLGIRGRKVEARIDEETGHIKKLHVDWKATKELWERRPDLKEAKHLVFYMNEHTNGVRYAVKWIKDKTKLINKTFYKFVPCRANKRQLAKLIKDGKEYLILE